MSINPSTAIDKALSKAAGESYVTYKLARKGWMAVNANSGVANMPNVDLIGLRHDKRITIQIKAANGDAVPRLRLGVLCHNGLHSRVEKMPGQQISPVI